MNDMKRFKDFFVCNNYRKQLIIGVFLLLPNKKNENNIRTRLLLIQNNSKSNFYTQFLHLLLHNYLMNELYKYLNGYY